MSYSEEAADEVREVIPEGPFTRGDVVEQVDMSLRHVATVLDGLSEQGELKRRKIGQTWLYVHIGNRWPTISSDSEGN